MLDRLERAVRARPDRLVPSPKQVGYRARITLNVGRNGVVGYHRPRSHELIPVTRDPLARDEVNDALARIQLDGVERFELRSDGTRVVANVHGPGTLSGLPWAREGKAVEGDSTLTLQVNDLELKVSAGSFYQVNLELNALLVQAVVDEVLARDPQHVLDLFAGIGNLSLPIAKTGVPCTLVERGGSSARDARANARRLGLDIAVQTGDANRFEPGSVAFDVAVFDPPRAGAAQAMRAVLVTRPRAIVYVSCNPRTLGRDLRPALNAGYRLTRFTGFDMFPGTDHVEALAVLDRAPR
jgi:tRNA/tmRNA/rRNA uracil-C5-methylase (TrmA/RlmC/RlmD family)